MAKLNLRCEDKVGFSTTKVQIVQKPPKSKILNDFTVPTETHYNAVLGRRTYVVFEIHKLLHLSATVKAGILLKKKKMKGSVFFSVKVCSFVVN